MTGLTGVVPITDRKQFSRSYEVLMRLATQNLPPDDGSAPTANRIRRFRFAGSDVHYANLGELGLAPAWWAGDKQLVVALAPQNIKAYLSRGKVSRSLADVPEVAAELSGRDPLAGDRLSRCAAAVRIDLSAADIAGPSYLGANGLSEGRRDMSMIPSLPSVCRHLRPGVATLAADRIGAGTHKPRQPAGLWPGAVPVMFLVWDSEWLNLVFGESENNAPPVPVVPGAGPAVPVAPPGQRRCCRRRSRHRPRQNELSGYLKSRLGGTRVPPVPGFVGRFSISREEEIYGKLVW